VVHPRPSRRGRRHRHRRVPDGHGPAGARRRHTGRRRRRAVRRDRRRHRPRLAGDRPLGRRSGCHRAPGRRGSSDARDRRRCRADGATSDRRRCSTRCRSVRSPRGAPRGWRRPADARCPRVAPQRHVRGRGDVGHPSRLAAPEPLGGRIPSVVRGRPVDRRATRADGCGGRPARHVGRARRAAALGAPLFPPWDGPGAPDAVGRHRRRCAPGRGHRLQRDPDDRPGPAPDHPCRPGHRRHAPDRARAVRAPGRTPDGRGRRTRLRRRRHPPERGGLGRDRGRPADDARRRTVPARTRRARAGVSRTRRRRWCRRHPRCHPRGPSPAGPSARCRRDGAGPGAAPCGVRADAAGLARARPDGGDADGVRHRRDAGGRSRGRGRTRHHG